MAKRRATTPEDRENQLIAAAINLAEKQILEGTASSNVITHFLKLGSTRERAEREKLKHEVELLKARKEGLEKENNLEELYREAIAAQRRYGGHYNDS